MASKCEECQGSGWAYGKEELHDIECFECNGAGWVYQSDIKWPEYIELQRKAGADSNPPYDVKVYKGGIGIIKPIFKK